MILDKEALGRKIGSAGKRQCLHVGELRVLGKLHSVKPCGSEGGASVLETWGATGWAKGLHPRLSMTLLSD